MGLDQHLSVVEPGVDVANMRESQYIEIGYWRKHADLQGYVASLAGESTDTFGGNFELTREHVLAILKCSEAGSFGSADGTRGFFFGQTYPEDHIQTAKIMKNALEYLDKGKRIVYSSSW